MAPSPRKRKASTKQQGSASSSSGPASKKKASPSTTDPRLTMHQAVGYAPLSLQDIHDRIQELCYRVPNVPESGFLLDEDQAAAAATDNNNNSKSNSNKDDKDDDETLPKAANNNKYDKKELREWAAGLQTVLEEFNLLVACINPATYVWGTDRSGAADQNLSLLSNEIVRSQEQITSRVAPRLNDVLAPVMTMVTHKTVTTKRGGGSNNNNQEEEEIKLNHFRTTPEDPDYVDLCFCILAQSATLLRIVVLSNFDKTLQAVQDYLTAQHKDSQHDSRGFVY